MVSSHGGQCFLNFSHHSPQRNNICRAHLSGWKQKLKVSTSTGLFLTTLNSSPVESATHTHTHTHTSLSRVRLFLTQWIVAYQAPRSMGFSRHEYWSGLPVSFARGSSWPRDRTRVSRIVGRHFTVWATREAHRKHKSRSKFQKDVSWNLL